MSSPNPSKQHLQTLSPMIHQPIVWGDWRNFSHSWQWSGSPCLTRLQIPARWRTGDGIKIQERHNTPPIPVYFTTPIISCKLYICSVCLDAKTIVKGTAHAPNMIFHVCHDVVAKASAPAPKRHSRSKGIIRPGEIYTTPNWLYYITYIYNKKLKYVFSCHCDKYIINIYIYCSIGPNATPHSRRLNDLHFQLGLDAIPLIERARCVSSPN